MSAQHQEEFSVRPFAAGTVRGVRTFAVHDCGDEDQCGNPFGLGAVSAAYQWQPGENVATCSPPFMTWYAITAPAMHKRVAGVECSCGFYAYFGDRNDYEDNAGMSMSRLFGGSATIAGVVEGYGVVTVGNRGFRAEKARIVALAWTVHVRPTPRLSAELERFGVPVYPSTAAMLAAHPTTRPEDVGLEPPKTTEPDYRRSGPVVVLGPGVQVRWGNGAVPGFVQQMATSAAAAAKKIDDLADQILKMQAAKQLAAGLRPQYSLYGIAPGSLDVTVGDADNTKPELVDPVKKLRSDKQAAAEARFRAGLRGVGGFDRRGRRR